MLVEEEVKMVAVVELLLVSMCSVVVFHCQRSSCSCCFRKWLAFWQVGRSAFCVIVVLLEIVAKAVPLVEVVVKL